MGWSDADVFCLAEMRHADTQKCGSSPYDVQTAKITTGRATSPLEAQDSAIPHDDRAEADEGADAMSRRSSPVHARQTASRSARDASVADTRLGPQRAASARMRRRMAYSGVM